MWQSHIVDTVQIGDIGSNNVVNHKNADIGIVTASTYSQRRGMSSGLGLISVDSFEKFKTDNLSVVAIEKQLNGKYYLAKFKILYQ